MSLLSFGLAVGAVISALSGGFSTAEAIDQKTSFEAAMPTTIVYAAATASPPPAISSGWKALVINPDAASSDALAGGFTFGGSSQAQVADGGNSPSSLPVLLGYDE